MNYFTLVAGVVIGGGLMFAAICWAVLDDTDSRLDALSGSRARRLLNRRFR